MGPPPRMTACASSGVPTVRRAWDRPRGYGWCERGPSGDVPAWRGPGSVDRGQEATGGAIEHVPSVLPGCALTESCQSLHVAPDRTRVRLVRFRQRVRLGGLLLRQ